MELMGVSEVAGGDRPIPNEGAKETHPFQPPILGTIVIGARRYPPSDVKFVVSWLSLVTDCNG